MPKKSLQGIVAVFLSFLPLVASGGPQSRFREIGPIVVSVRRTQGRLECELDDRKYSKQDLFSQLARLKLASEDTPRRVLVMLDDSTLLSDLSLVPQMAVNAGFTDIQVFAVWPKTGNMAEVVFGPVKKISKDPTIIERERQ
jgi:hypothetical protein